MNTLSSIINMVFENRYYDSVVLMSIAGRLKKELELDEISLMMGTDANKDLLSAIGLLTPEGKTARAGDLIIAAAVKNISQESSLKDSVEEALSKKGTTESDDYYPRSIDGALEMLPGANLAIISIPGEHVEWEAKKLLDKGLHLFIFSDNVPLETEIMLKKKGEELGLLVMGPDCGTAIIGGVATGFANKVRQGNIGIVAAAGTGIQEVSTLIHKMGAGISHAIGTGGRDLSKEVGAITMKMGILTLAEDPDTDVLVLISKPPHPDVEKEIFNLLNNISKPVIINFLGSDAKESKPNITFAPTLEDAAVMAVEATGIKAELPTYKNSNINIEELENKLSSSQKYLRALYSGGTLANEAITILKNSGISVYSNLSKDPAYSVKNPAHSYQHTIIDIGDDYFTKGAPHPMIDQTKRLQRIIDESKDPETAVILLDLVLGYGANDDPAPEIAQAVKEAQDIAKKDGRHIIFVASVCGVPDDPQDSERQRKTLEDAGVLCFPSDKKAVEFSQKFL